MKTSSLIRLFMPLLLAFTVSSCVVYHPHNVDISLLHQRGQLQLDGSLSLSAPLFAAPAVNATASYAPLNHMGVQAAASLTSPHYYYFQGAAGTWFTSGNFVAEGYLGYGYGRSLIDSASTSLTHNYQVDGNYDLYFGQINLGLADLANGHIDMGLGLKGGYLTPNFKQTEFLADGLTQEASTYADPSFLIQPQLMFRFGFSKLKFSFNLGYTYLTQWAFDNNYFNYDRLSLSAGVSYRF